MLDPKEEAKFAELKDKCRELKVLAPPEIMIGLQVHEGGVLTFDDVQRGHSWTRNFYNTLLSFYSLCGGTSASFGAGYINAKATTAGVANGDRTIYVANSATSAHGIIEDATTGNYGIKIGTDDTAFSPEQYTLISPAATLASIAMGVATLSYDAGTHIWKATISRIFNNNTGSSVTIKETGLYWSENIFQVTGIFMWERSVLSPTVTVANGAQLTVTYEISMDFSAID
jgi:hypothetical protein